MDLFTYLMAKNGNNTSVHGDLFSYLLGKSQSQTQTISGVTIYIPDAKKLVSFMMTKESTQATSILPSEYTQVDYIKSSGTQYLLLNYNAKATSSYELSLKFNNINNDWTNSNRSFISGRDFETTDSQYFQINYGSSANEKQTLYVWINSGQSTSTAKKGVGSVIESKNSLIINNGQMNYGSFSSTTPIATGVNSQSGFLLFAGRLIDSGNTPLIFDGYDMYVYDFKIYESDVLVKHYIPCYRNSDNEVGLYEIINGEFFTNQGTGAFTYGSVAQLPNPDYPIEVKTVKGSVDVKVVGKNLFNENSSWNIDASIASGTNLFPYTTGGNRRTYFFLAKPNTKYTFSFKTPGDRFLICEHYSIINPLEYTSNNPIYLDRQECNITENIPNSYTFTTTSNTKMIAIYYSLNQLPVDFMIEENSTATTYEAYKETTTTIPLNNNELVGIGDYKDELLVDKSGNVSIEKNTTKIDSYNGETITTTYMSTTGGLDTGATVYYGIDTPNLIDLQTTVDLSLFKGVNNVSNSVDGYMTIEYR